MILADMIAEYFHQKRTSLRRQAKLIGISHTTLHRFVHGKPIEDRPLAKIIIWLLSEEA